MSLEGRERVREGGRGGREGGRGGRGGDGGREGGMTVIHYSNRYV